MQDMGDEISIQTVLCRKLFDIRFQHFLLILAVGFNDIIIRVKLEESLLYECFHNVSLVAKFFIVRSLDFSKDKVYRLGHFRDIAAVDILQQIQYVYDIDLIGSDQLDVKINIDEDRFFLPLLLIIVVFKAQPKRIYFFGLEGEIYNFVKSIFNEIILTK